MPEVDNLREKAFKGVFWSYINKFGTQIIAILPAMILARLLSPSEYGLIATSAIFSGIAYILSDGGFSSALLQKKDCDQLDYCSIYYFNIFINISIYIVFFFLSPLFAIFFEEPLITPIARVSLLSLPIAAFGSVHAIILKRELNFRAPAVRNLIVQGSTAIIAIVLALCGFGVWALVIQGVLQTLGNAIANRILSKWKASFLFSFERLRNMFKFGSRVYAAQLIDYSFGKGYDTTIAKFYSAEELSYYGRAFSTAEIFINSFLGVVNNVAFPVFTKMQGDIKRVLYNARRFMIISCMLIFTLMTTICILAEPLFHFMYSSKWDEVIPYFQIVCIWGLFRPINTILNNITMAIGHSDVIMNNSIIEKVLIVITISLTWNLGIKYMLIGRIVIIVASIIFLSIYSNKFYNYSLYNIIIDIYKYIISSLVIGIIVYTLDKFLFSHINIGTEFISSGLRLSLGILSSIVSFLTLYHFLKLEAYQDLFSLLIDSIKNQIIKKILIIFK